MPRPFVTGSCALILFVAVTISAATGDRARGGTEPLTNEDVVRMVMTGTSDRAVIAAIGERKVDFNLDPDIVTELRVAGVSSAVIEAMRRRQTAMPRVPPAPTPTPAPEVAATLRVLLESGSEEEGNRSVIAVSGIPSTMKRPPGMEVGLVTDLALAVLCTSTHHVPDHWALRTPIEDAPRHALLLFEEGSVRESKKGFEFLRLVTGMTHILTLPAGRHRISVLTAGKGVGSGTWRVMVADDRMVTVEPGGTATLKIHAQGKIAGSHMTGFRVENEWNILAEESAPGDHSAPERS